MLTNLGAITIETPPESGPVQGAAVRDLLALPGGGFSVLWGVTVSSLIDFSDPTNPGASSTDLYFATFGPSAGQKISILHSDAPLQPYRGVLALTSDATVAVFSADGTKIEAREYTLQGGLLNGPTQAVPFSATLPVLGDAIGIGANQTFLVYRARVGEVDQLFGQVFGPGSIPLGQPTQLSPTLDTQYGASIARLADGRLVIGYGTSSATDAGNIGILMADGNGTPVTNAPLANQVTIGDQRGVQVEALSSGGFVAVWTDLSGSDGSGAGVRARVYDASGNAITSDFLVNTTTPEAQYNPVVTALTGGRFAVAWESDLGGGQILGQAYDRFGNAIGTETFLAWGQSPRVEMLTDGSMLLTITRDVVQEGVLAFTFDPGKAGTSGPDALDGATLGRFLEGLEGNDTIIGTSFADRLEGDQGKDILTGGKGSDSRDTFVFDTPLSKNNVDTIKDYEGKYDQIFLDDSYFKRMGKGTEDGTLLKRGMFIANETGVATSSNAQIVYEKDTGNLFYDADGDGGKAVVQFATLTGAPKITIKDFEII